MAVLWSLRLSLICNCIFLLTDEGLRRAGPPPCLFHIIMVFQLPPKHNLRELNDQLGLVLFGEAMSITGYIFITRSGSCYPKPINSASHHFFKSFILGGNCLPPLHLLRTCPLAIPMGGRWTGPSMPDRPLEELKPVFCLPSTTLRCYRTMCKGHNPKQYAWLGSNLLYLFLSLLWTMLVGTMCGM